MIFRFQSLLAIVSDVKAEWELNSICCKTASKVVKKAKGQSWSTFGEQMETNYWNLNKVFWQTLRRIGNLEKRTFNVIKLVNFSMMTLKFSDDERNTLKSCITQSLG